MFTHRASETSRASFLNRYRSVLCGLGIAALTCCVSPKAFAATAHNPTSVLCGSFDGGTNGDANSVVVPSSSDPATIDAVNTYSIDGSGEQCAWTFPNVPSTATVTATLQVASSSDCSGDQIHNGHFGIGNPFAKQWQSKNAGPSTVTYSIPSGTGLNPLTVYGVANAGANDNCVVNLTLTKLYVTY
jgi:hypothetical protein